MSIPDARTRLHCGGDIAVICGITIVSSILYLKSLGFTSDDFSFLSTLTFSDDQSFRGMYAYLGSGVVGIRPVQVALLVALFKAFGTDPFGFHLFNVVVFCGATSLLYLVLRQLSTSRPLALGIALLFAVLPEASTDHFWVASFQIPLSVLFLLVSTSLDLRSVSSSGLRLVLLEVASVTALALSGLAYEITLPLFLFGPIAAWYVSHAEIRKAVSVQRQGVAGSSVIVTTVSASVARCSFILARNLALVAAIFAFKSALNLRGGLPHDVQGILGTLGTNLRSAFDPGGGEADFGVNAARFLGSSFVNYGLALPQTAYAVWMTYGTRDELFLSLLLAVVAAAVLYLAAFDGPASSVRRVILTGLVGIVVSVLGIGVFLVTPDIQFTLAGIGNRVFLLSAIGVAGFITAVLWLVTLALAPATRRLVFSLLMGLFIGSGCLINSVIGKFWVEARARQDKILADIQQSFPTLPQGATVMLDGACPYSGPAVVFESPWDLSGLLQLAYKDDTIQADIMSSRAEIGPQGIQTQLYGQTYLHAYGPSFFIYDAERRTATPIPDYASGQRYAASARGRLDRCGRGYEGVGVPVFKIAAPWKTPLVAETSDAITAYGSSFPAPACNLDKAGHCRNTASNRNALADRDGGAEN